MLNLSELFGSLYNRVKAVKYIRALITTRVTYTVTDGGGASLVPLYEGHVPSAQNNIFVDIFSVFYTFLTVCF